MFSSRVCGCIASVMSLKLPEPKNQQLQPKNVLTFIKTVKTRSEGSLLQPSKTQFVWRDIKIWRLKSANHNKKISDEKRSKLPYNLVNHDFNYIILSR